MTLPKGGGAIRGIGERFAANPVTGTCALSVPIPTSSSRSAFGPQLTLAYDSGSGNGPFGYGWSLSLPSITRKTGRGLPRYLDDAESDVFLFGGGEDLVPALVRRAGEWVPDTDARRVDGVDYRIRRYRRRTEAAFARIERWTGPTGATHWRSISRDNVTTIYGRTDDSRIADPADTARVFSWLASESYDDRGNAILYQYHPENSDGVHVAAPHERNRTSEQRAANRYPRRIRYGNRTPRQPDEDLTARADWLFDVVFDYGGHYAELPLDPARPVDDQHRLVDATAEPTSAWDCRTDPFSSYLSGFEVRTYRLCRRVLMFHAFDELGATPTLVRSLACEYADADGATLMRRLVQSGYVDTRPPATGVTPRRYLRRSMPALDFSFSRASIDPTIHELDAAAIDGLPQGVDGSLYQWVDLNGEGLSGILTEQGGAWYFKRNEGSRPPAFAAAEQVAPRPAATLAGSDAQLLDLSGNGQLDIVQWNGPARGFYERTRDGGWSRFQTLTSWPNINIKDPQLRFVDIDGDGRADILITEDNAFAWHPSLGAEGFGERQSAPLATDDERGPRLLFADGTQSIHLADCSGDGLTDLLRIRNGEVCYWPNLGYGRFGAKITMDNAPVFDTPESFDQRRIRVTDVDGTGPADIIYIAPDALRVYFNRSGNGWSAPVTLPALPRLDHLSTVSTVDLHGSGTACLVWSSPTPADASRPLRYLDLMGGQKPRLLVSVKNNLGAETEVTYAPSTRFYTADRAAERPWVTRLPFPVQVVERVETLDRLSGNRFVTRYEYHHGYFDGGEREFRGFGCVDQWDTDVFDVATARPWDLPPVHTRTWYHTGAWLDGERLSRAYAREYAGGSALPESVVPVDLRSDDLREAARALKGMMLRQEIYADDHSEASARPYRVSERNYTVTQLQPRLDQPFAVFHTHARESLDVHLERAASADPRVTHTVVLSVNDYGSVRESVSIAYGRTGTDPRLGQVDQRTQAATLATLTTTDFTNAVVQDDSYRAPLPADAQTYQLFKLPAGARLSFADVRRAVDRASTFDLPYDDVQGGGATDSHSYRRLIERIQTRYRPDDFGVSANDDPQTLLPLRHLESLALPGDVFKLAFPAGLFDTTFGGLLIPPDPNTVRQAGYVAGAVTGEWWVPVGRVYYSPDPDDAASVERAEARRHFYLPRRFHDPFFAGGFKTHTTVTYDRYDLLPLDTVDGAGNHVSTSFRDDAGTLSGPAWNDYRVLQPFKVMDANRNCTAAAFDACGFTVAVALMGKPEQQLGDSLAGLTPDLTAAEVAALTTTASGTTARALLKDATTRMVYDLDRFARQGTAAVTAKVAREIHVSSAVGDSPLQIAFAYSDGFAREIQKKAQAEPDAAGQARWVTSGWTIFNNKGKVVQRFDPFFSTTHAYEPDTQVGVTPTMFYDPLQRLVATVHPNGTYDKVAFDPWGQRSWDAGDTVLDAPDADEHVGDLTAAYVATLRAKPGGWKTWYERRAPMAGTPEQDAAVKSAFLADTPTITACDALGRSFLTTVHNRFKLQDRPVVEQQLVTRTDLDIEGNTLRVTDAAGRVVVKYGYDMLGTKISQASMDAGRRWMLNDASGKPCRVWDSRGHTFGFTYDTLHRPLASWIAGHDPAAPTSTMVFERTEYGEGQANDVLLNLRARIYRQFDQAGTVTNAGINPATGDGEAYDFKGNLVRSVRRVLDRYDQSVDWSPGAAPVFGDSFAFVSAYDALDRATSQSLPDGTTLEPTYNEAALLTKIDAHLRGAAATTAFVRGIDYDPKGQRTAVRYGNGAETTLEYDQETFRLIRLTTKRPGPDTVQDLRYTHDVSGNTTTLRDLAQQEIYFLNQVVDATATYTFDAARRLIAATGREHLGRSGTALRPPTSPNAFNAFHTGHAQPNNAAALGRYIEWFSYDTTGNLQVIEHIGTTPTSPGWTRSFSYAEPSAIDAADSNNRLTSSAVGAEQEDYRYDAHGNACYLPHLGGDPAHDNLRWDGKDRLVRLERGGGGTVHYAYDANGQRVRKVWVKSPGVIEETIYAGAYERFRIHDGNGNTALLRETVHVMDDKRRVAMVETTTIEGGAAIDRTLHLYQFGNHLGSACLELDAVADVISYEEYYPYGSTSYQAARSQTEVSKRYRYSGKERDAESGLYYHGARYYAPWIGRWTAADPGGLVDGPNLYLFARANPVMLSDPSGRAGEFEDLSAHLMDDMKAVEDPAKLAIGEKKPGGTVLNELPEAERRMQETEVDARKKGNVGADKSRRHAKSEKKNPGGVGKPRAGDEMAHMSAARHNATSAIPNDIANHPDNIKAMPAQGKQATVTRQDGTSYQTDIHSAHELKLDEIQARNQAGKKPGTIDSSVAAQHAMHEAKITTEVMTREHLDQVEGKTKGVKAGQVVGAIGIALTLKAVSDSMKQGDYTGAVVSTASLNPVVGNAMTVKAAYDEYQKGNTARAALELATLHPVVSAAKSGWDIGRKLDEEYELGETASTYWADKLGPLLYGN